VLTVAGSVTAVVITTNPAEFFRPPLVDNPLKPEDFSYENGFLTCKTAETVVGIDVSEFQGNIDWQEVKNAGVAFVFIRVGWRGLSEGTLNPDKRAQEYYHSAKEAGLLVGAYFFSQALSAEEAQEEAEFALQVLKKFPLDLPLAYDWETVEGKTRTDGVTRETLTKCIKTFCDTVEDGGYQSMVYFNRDLSQTLLDIRKLGGMPVWFAMYHTYPDAPCKPDYWQYTDQGTVPGIEGYVDLNLYLP
jgi:GH25 family lysozyme M1 (1,4-beta-N-acetylmuramidase)